LTQPARDKSIETSVALMSEAVGDLSKEIASAIGALTVLSGIDISCSNPAQRRQSPFLTFIC
jgi:hypothetical protein